MANEFKNFKLIDVPLVGESIYTCPANTEAIVIGMQVSNKIEDIVAVEISLATAVLVDAPIPPQAALEPISGKLVVPPGESIIINPDTASAIDASISLLEITP